MQTRIPGLLAAALCFAWIVPNAAAASVVCERLRDRLADVSTIIGENPEINSYASAIAQQNLELRKARQDQKRLRCLTSAVVVVRPEGGSDCGDLSEALDRMEANKDILVAKLEEIRSGGAQSRDARARLTSALEANRCSAQTDGTFGGDVEEAERVPYLDTLAEPYQVSRNSLEALPDQPAALPTGNIRTLCVRTCDGGFFPISSSTSAMNFAHDAGLCQQMCPNTETELYFHAPAVSETSEMISAVSGRPYRDLPNAFAYRNRTAGDNPQCGCDLARFHEQAKKRLTPNPTFPDYQSSIVTIAPKAPAVAAARPTEQPIERAYDGSAANIRKVGPQFLPPVSGAINLRNPAAPGPQPLQE